jgi:uncharacterized protein YkwD
MRYLLVLAAALAVASAPVSAAAPTQAPSGIDRRSELEREVLRELNRVRSVRGLEQLRSVTGLRAAAAAHSKSMLEVGFFDHASADGTTFDRRLRRHYPDRGWQVWSVGETLLATSANLDSQLIVAEWIKSRSHRKIILTPAWRDVGIGAQFAASAPREFGGAPTTVVTADFGVRTSKMPTSRG